MGLFSRWRNRKAKRTQPPRSTTPPTQPRARVVRVAYWAPGEPWPRSDRALERGGYAYAWRLAPEPQLGDIVRVTGAAKDTAAVIVGFGRAGYAGPLESVVRRVADRDAQRLRATAADPPRAPFIQTGVRPIRRSDYLSPEDESKFVTVDVAGLPNLWLERRGGELILRVEQGVVNPRSTQLYRRDLFVFNVRGTSHYAAATKAADFSPGSPVRLVREPGNEHDANAVAIYGKGGRRVTGYVNKQNARRLAARIDAGEQFEAVSLRGGQPSIDGATPRVAVAPTPIMRHLMRKLNAN